MKKILTTSLAVIIYSTSAYAGDPEVKLNGGIDVQAGYVKNSLSTAQKNYVTGNSKQSGMNSTAHIQAEAKNTTDAGMEYGAKISLATTGRSARKTASSLYIISQAGKWELGSEKSANGKMKITPYTNACATAGGWDSWGKGDPSSTGIVYVTNFGNFTDPKVRDADQSEYARKVTYYTPHFAGFQFGVSYIPDTTNAGYTTPGTVEGHDAPKTKDLSGYKVDIKKAFAGGVTYTKTEGDFGIKLALVGETGKAAPKAIAGVTQIADAKFKKLRTYTVGTQINYKDVSFTGAYSNYMKSLTSAAVDTLGRNTDLYGFGLRYNHPSKVSVSATYFLSNSKKNKMEAITLATEYKLAPGILPYAEVTFYKGKGRYIKDQKLATPVILSHKNRGTAVIIGMKLEF